MNDYQQAPTARLDYAVDWGPFLDSLGGDFIVTAEWVHVSEGLDIEDQGFEGGLHVVYVSGGEPMQTYRITSRVTTDAGRVAEETITFFIRRT